MALRRLLALLLLACACAPPLIVRREGAMLPPAAPPECHLILRWHDSSTGSDPAIPSDTRARVLRLLREEPRSSCRRIASWQVIDRPDKLVPLAQVWRPSLPVLWVSLDHRRAGKEGQPTVHVRVQSRLQAGIFETSEAPAPVELDTSTTSYESSVKATLDSITLQPSAPVLSIRRVDGAKAAEALAASQKGDWPEAAGLWAEAASQQRDVLAAAANASAAYELAGDVKQALSWQERLLDSATGLGGMFRLAMLLGNDGTDREAALNGLLAEGAPPIAALGPKTTLAVLPLDNQTPDLEADERVRAGLQAAFAAAGYAPVAAKTVDERLKQEGITMAGHLAALKWDRIGKRVKAEFLVAGSVEEFRALPRRQVRVRLSLIHAPDNREVFADTVEAADLLQDSRTVAGFLAQTIVSAVAQKVSGKTLVEETKEAVERFTAPLPHFAAITKALPTMKGPP